MKTSPLLFLTLAAALLAWLRRSGVLLLLAGVAATGQAQIPWQLSFSETNRILETSSPANNHTQYGIVLAGQTVVVTASNQAINVYRLTGFTNVTTIVTNAATPYTNSSLAVGHYFIETSGDRRTLAVLPSDFGRPSLSGAHSTRNNSIHGSLNNATYPAWERVSGGALATWEMVETNQSLLNTTLLNTYFVAATNNTRTVLVFEASVNSVPAWLTTNGLTFAQWRDQVVVASTNYMRQVLELYSGYPLDYWEPLNEPSIPYAVWNTTANKTNFIYELTRAAWYYANIQTNIANLKIMGISEQSPSWLGTMFNTLCAAGMSNYFDAYSYHHYPSSNNVDNIPYENALYWHPGAGAKPLWIGEEGIMGESSLGVRSTANSNSVVTYSGIPWYTGMRRGTKVAVLYKAVGATGIVPHMQGAAAYTYNHEPDEVCGFEMGGGTVDNTRGPHPKNSAFLMACYRLQGYSPQSFTYHVVGSTTNAWTATFTNNLTQLTVKACVDGYTTNVSVSGASDVWGDAYSWGTLADESAFFTSPLQWTGQVEP